MFVSLLSQIYHYVVFQIEIYHRKKEACHSTVLGVIKESKELERVFFKKIKNKKLDNIYICILENIYFPSHRLIHSNESFVWWRGCTQNKIWMHPAYGSNRMEPKSDAPN